MFFLWYYTLLVEWHGNWTGNLPTINVQEKTKKFEKLNFLFLGIEHFAYNTGTPRYIA
jgi:hypothetical protein